MPPSPAVLAEHAKTALKQSRAAWSFIFDPKTDPIPDNFDQAVRAMVLTGADATDIVGAITIAAMRRNCKDHWSYACGVVRQTVNTRLSMR